MDAGSRPAAVSTGAGQVAIDAYEFDTALPEDIKQINSKVATDRSADENRRLEEYYQSGLQRLALLEIPAAVYALDFHPDGKSLAAAGSDGMIRIVDVEHGTIQREFAAVPTTDLAAQPGTPDRAKVIFFRTINLSDELADDAQIASLAVDPERIVLSDCFDYVQLVVTATLASGQRVDVTRMAHGTCIGGHCPHHATGNRAAAARRPGGTAAGTRRSIGRDSGIRHWLGRSVPAGLSA